MKIISNPKKIQRYYKIGMYTSFGALILLFGAVGLTLYTAQRPELQNYPFVLMLFGLILSQIGVYFANRWGKSPRVDERITASLKGLDDRYTLYHYTSPVPHLLVGPAGVWVLVSQYHPGTITYENKRYRQKGVGIFARFIGQEAISRPDVEAQAYQEDMQKFLKKSLPENSLPPVQTAIVFTSPKSTVSAAEAPIATMHVDKLKDFLRRKLKEQPVSNAQVNRIQEVLPKEEA